MKQKNQASVTLGICLIDCLIEWTVLCPAFSVTYILLGGGGGVDPAPNSCPFTRGAWGH